MDGARRFFAEAEADITDPAVWAGELYLELHRGTYTTQAATKWGNRRSEIALRETELWTSLAPTTRPPPAAIEQLWKSLLLHQFHDIIPGSGIHWVYQDTADAHARILDETGRLAATARSHLAVAVETAGLTHPVVVFNSLSHARTELVATEAADGFRPPSTMPEPSERCSATTRAAPSSRPPCRPAATASTTWSGAHLRAGLGSSSATGPWRTSIFC